MKQIKVCENCGKVKPSKNVRFCCLECRREFRAKTRPLCPICGEVIFRKGNKFCSRECFWQDLYSKGMKPKRLRKRKIEKCIICNKVLDSVSKFCRDCRDKNYQKAYLKKIEIELIKKANEENLNYCTRHKLFYLDKCERCERLKEDNFSTVVKDFIEKKELNNKRIFGRCVDCGCDLYVGGKSRCLSCRGKYFERKYNSVEGKACCIKCGSKMVSAKYDKCLKCRKEYLVREY